MAANRRDQDERAFDKLAPRDRAAAMRERITEMLK